MKYALFLLIVCCSVLTNTQSVCGTYDPTSGCVCNTGCVCSILAKTCIFVPQSVTPVATLQAYCSASS